MRPLISICIPTFNRAACLEGLFKNLERIKSEHGSKMEICISNNHSTDATIHVIMKWCSRLELVFVTQASNIGATLNVIAVTSLATGKWLMLLGDDDLLIQVNFSKLLNFLVSVNEEDWVVVGIAGVTGEEHLLGNLTPGQFESKVFQKTVLHTGLQRFGFIGMHIYPSSLQETFAGLSISQSQSWPHLAVLLRHIQTGRVQVFPLPVVGQAAGGVELFWNIGDWVLINLKKLNIIYEAKILDGRFHCFFDALFLRELYSLQSGKNLILWKILDPDNFHKYAYHEHAMRYRLLGLIRLLAIVHVLFLLLLYITPSALLRFLLRLIGKQRIVDSYIYEREMKNNFDGVKRGL